MDKLAFFGDPFVLGWTLAVQRPSESVFGAKEIEVQRLWEKAFVLALNYVLLHIRREAPASFS